MGLGETLMVGTCGWDRGEWVGSYYPEELPEDWRFGYYSNEYRAVLMTADHWKLEQPMADWIEDADEEFRMVLELPAELSRPGSEWSRYWDAFRQDSALLDPFRRGYLLSPDPEMEPDTAWLEHVLGVIGVQAPVSVDLRGPWRSEPVRECARSHRATLCWHADDESVEDPAVDGLWAALSTTADPRGQRATIERLGAWMERTGGTAGLFFFGNKAPAAAASARLIAEMLVI